MPTDHEIREQARARARTLLAQSDTFLNLPEDQQMEMYRDTVNAQYQELVRQPELAQAQGLVEAFGNRGASRDIDESRHENRDLDRTGDRARDFMDSVDFPAFVEDLLKSVFDATLNVTQTQMQDYMAMLKEATKDVSYYVKQIDDSTAFKYLVDNSDDDQFQFTFPPGGDDEALPDTITDKEGNPVERDKVITDAKRKMAEEQRTLLREMILMGVSRIVIDKGTVKAAVVFDVKASENIQKSDRATAQSTYKRAKSHRRRNFWGRHKGGTTSNYKRTSISVSSAKSTAQTELAAKITGEVEINFKSDYFKLDNFAQMYGNQANAEQQDQRQLPAGE